jgi:hypothetical protein
VNGLARETASAVQLVGGLRNLAALVAGSLEFARTTVRRCSISSNMGEQIVAQVDAVCGYR